MRTAQSVLRAISIYYHSLLFIKSDNKAITLGEDCFIFGFDFMSVSCYSGFLEVKTPKGY